jgi:uncharacterized protein (DUF2336 family)
MIVERFLQWIRIAPADARAQAARSLVRAFVWPDLPDDERRGAEVAMTVLLDDPSTLVRQALAESLAPCAQAPAHVVLALAHDLSDVAQPILSLSPVLTDPDLVDLAATRGPAAQLAIAGRRGLSAAVAAAIVEVGDADACCALLRNRDATLSGGMLARMVDLHGGDLDLRRTLLDRPELPIALRHALLSQLADALADFVVDRDWLSRGRADSVARDAADRVTVELAHEHPSELAALVVHLHADRRLTPTLILRALLSGDAELAEEALAQLAGIARARLQAIVADPIGLGIAPLLRRTGLPRSTQSAVRAAIVARRTFSAEEATGTGLQRAVAEQALALYAETASADIDPVLSLLRRFVAEAARDEGLRAAAVLVGPRRLTAA